MLATAEWTRPIVDTSLAVAMPGSALHAQDTDPRFVHKAFLILVCASEQISLHDDRAAGDGFAAFFAKKNATDRLLTGLRLRFRA